MTKKIRIENADTSNHKVRVQVWEKTTGAAPDILVEETVLRNPTDMLEKTIWSDRYLVIKEAI